MVVVAVVVMRVGVVLWDFEEGEGVCVCVFFGVGW